MKNVHLEEIIMNDREKYLDYLLLADEDEQIVKQYINEGDMYSISMDGQLVGIILFVYHQQRVVELKNLALAPEWRGRGIGKAVLQKAFDIYKGMEKMIVGTANSSIENIAFYQKAGFRMTEIRRGFFEKYAKPIFENGIQALDMVMFERDL
ncbi:GNAT family N-acetyltransferase [Bacillus gobiensis]|uniref:GNAT family N-acetyltransferase n=1 Tax=Bacillus gobiensis TaxID=1441095 RepID=UPI003D1CAAA7